MGQRSSVDGLTILMLVSTSPLLLMPIADPASTITGLLATKAGPWHWSPLMQQQKLSPNGFKSLEDYRNGSCWLCRELFARLTGKLSEEASDADKIVFPRLRVSSALGQGQRYVNAKQYAKNSDLKFFVFQLYVDIPYTIRNGAMLGILFQD